MELGKVSPPPYAPDLRIRVVLLKVERVVPGLPGELGEVGISLIRPSLRALPESVDSSVELPHDPLGHDPPGYPLVRRLHKDQFSFWQKCVEEGALDVQLAHHPPSHRRQLGRGEDA